jgi:hypothetical protein
MAIDFIGNSNGRLWITTRTPPGSTGVDPFWGAWTVWNDLGSLAGGPGPLRGTLGRVSCARDSGGRLHVLALTSTGLFHTIRARAPSTWQPWGPVHQAAFEGLPLGLTFDCAAIGLDLHVVCEIRPSGGQPQSLPYLSHSARIDAAFAWRTTLPNNVGNGTNAPLPAEFQSIYDVACANAAGALHIVTRGVRTTGRSSIYHDILSVAGGGSTLQGNNSILAVFTGFDPALNQTTAVACAGDGADLHVLASNGTETYHTIRFPTAWRSMFSPLSPSVGNGAATPLASPACTAADPNNLHIFAIRNGAPMHTIRLSATGAFRNPEGGASGLARSLLDGVPPGPAGAPLQMFSSVACA